jgi:chaperonin cofactor prefoldin
MGQEKQQQIEYLENKVRRLTKQTTDQEAVIKELQSEDKQGAGTTEKLPKIQADG